MVQCEFVPPEGPCPRPAVDGRDRCPFHLAPGERREAGVSSGDLREAFLADVRSGEDRRRTIAGARFEDLDLSSLVVEGDGLGGIAFRNVTVEGALDLSGSAVRHPLVVDGCGIGHLRATDTAFDAEVRIEGSTLGGDGTCLTARRASFGEGLEVADTRVRGSVEFAACSVGGWLDVEATTVAGRAHFPRATLGMAQFIDAAFEDAVEFGGADADHLTLENVRLAAGLDLSEAALGTFRSRPAGDAAIDLTGATLSGGRLDQPAEGRALYDLTGAVVGDVDLDCSAATFDRYRFRRTRFDGFPFAAYRDLLRDNGWRLHGYAGGDEPGIEELELTYLQAKQGATAAGDDESAAAFFVNEMRYRRGRYAAHARDPGYTPRHRAGAAVRWATTGFLGLLAGYGERPQRVLVAALLVILGAALVYPAAGGLDTGTEVVTYASDGVAALLDGLYFSVVTFATLGLGDVEPAAGAGRLVAGAEALAGAFLTALFVFALGRSVTR